MISYLTTGMIDTTQVYENLTVPEATAIQRELREKLDLSERSLMPCTIAGADISLNLYSATVYAGIVLLSFPDLQPMACSLVKAETRFPYVPGYLAFREVPSLLKAWEMLPQKPDILITDGHGIAHPRRLGIAAHFGALSGQTTMGCAKKILFGRYHEPDTDAGSASEIRDKADVIGWAFRSKKNVAPVYISPGYGMGLQNSLDIMRRCVGKYRIPEPTRLAHTYVNKFRKGELSPGFHVL